MVTVVGVPTTGVPEMPIENRAGPTAVVEVVEEVVEVVLDVLDVVDEVDDVDYVDDVDEVEEVDDVDELELDAVTLTWLDWPVAVLFSVSLTVRT